MRWLGKLSFVHEIIRNKQGLPRKHKRKKPQTNRHAKKKPCTSKQNEIRLQAFADEISRLRNKLAAVSDLQKTTLALYNDEHVSLQASTLENTQLKSELALARETICVLQDDFEQSQARYSENKQQIATMENKMTQSSWYKQDLADLMRLYDECAYDKNMLEYHIRQRAAEEEVLKHHPNLRDPITMEMVRNPVQMPPPCNCTCVFNHNMLDELYHKGFLWSNRCPNCR
jgi:chromosome segregation ATPase